MKFRYALTAFALLALSASAHAYGDDDDFEHATGPYVYLSGGASLAYNACKSDVLNFVQSLGGTGTCNDKNLSYRVGFGYQYTPMWALEVSWGQFGWADQRGFASFPAPIGPGNYVWTLQANGGALQAVATVHLTDSTAVFAKFGVARVEYDENLDIQAMTPPPPPYAYWSYTGLVNDKGNVPALAAGFQINTGPHGSIRLAAESYGSKNIYAIYDLNKPVRLVSASLALMWRF